MHFQTSTLTVERGELLGFVLMEWRGVERQRPARLSLSTGEVALREGEYWCDNPRFFPGALLSDGSDGWDIELNFSLPFNRDGDTGERRAISNEALEQAQRWAHEGWEQRLSEAWAAEEPARASKPRF